MRYHLTPVRMAIIESEKIANVSEDVDEKKYLNIVAGNES
jgi:hypothetical protein